MSVSFQLGLLMIAIGFVPGSLGGLIFLRRLRFLRTACTTFGVVSEVTLMHLVDGNSYLPKITFITQTGEKVELTSVIMSNPPQFQVGQEVPVVYDPHDPRRARLRSFAGLWFKSLFFGGLGSLFFLIALMLMLINKN